MPKLYNIEAKYHREVQAKHGIAHRVKVEIYDIGIFINGMMVYEPNKKFKDWCVYPPGMPGVPGKFTVEFNKKLPLWKEIEEKCLEAAKLECSNIKDVVITDIPDTGIDFDAIPFP